MSIRVVLADSQTLVRAGVRAVLAGTPDIEVIGEAATGAEAFAAVCDGRPNVVVLDLKMAAGDGIDTIRNVRRRCPGTQVLVLTTYGDPGLFRQAAAAGATGYVLKDISPANLAAAIRAVHRGETMINPRIARQLLTDIAANRSLGEPARRGPYGLTERDVQVLEKVSAGLSDKEIAGKLFLSQSTVKSHLRTIYRRLRLRNRAQAVAFAIERKLVDPVLAGR